jgi:hypothetical protein
MTEPFTLTDGEILAMQFPATFEIPDLIERITLEPGDIVRLGFELDLPIGDYQGERMYVTVTERTPNGYIGRVRSYPAFVDLEHGDEVAFEPRHILDIEPAR